METATASTIDQDGNGGGQARHQEIDQETDASTEQYSDHPSRACQHNGFGQELPDYIAAPCADGFAYADFPGALCDGH
jgi:hypothetical protein